MPCNDNRTQQEGERLLFFPGKDSASEKLWTLCLLQPSQILLHPIKVFSFPCHEGDCIWLQIPNCNPLLIPNKPIFAEEISGRILVLGQHFGGPYRDQRRPQKILGLVSKQVQFLQIEPIVTHCFSHQP